MRLELFDYQLPERYIAQKPLRQRDKSKLLVLDRKTGNIKHHIFYNIINYLNKNDVLVINESKVLKCRLSGEKEKTGAKIECIVLKKIKDNQYIILARPFKRLKISNKIFINDKYYFTVKSKLSYGEAIVEFNISPEIIFKECGKIPLPPYIKNNNIDESCYQTVYSSKDGSAAAPTAGFHFTENLIKKLQDKGINLVKLLLNIGIDTFRPIKEKEIEKHKMHKEYYYISGTEAKKIVNARKKGRRIVAVGTTTTRVLETLMAKHKIIKGDSGFTDLYVYPGYKFKVVDALITNFHLPRSTLLVMVSAFAGRDKILNAYEEAKKAGYRFYSFGDCMFIK